MELQLQSLHYQFAIPRRSWMLAPRVLPKEAWKLPEGSRSYFNDVTSRNVYLHEQGRVNLKPDGALLEAKEPLCTLSNFPIRGKVWNFTHVACNYINGNIALADERGQVIVINLVSSTYQVARLAHTAISAIEFVHPSGGSAKHTGHLVIAYESGRALIIDCTSKESVGHLQADGSSAFRILKCHPSEEVAVSVNDQRVMSIWDLRLSRCVMQFDATEPVVHVAFDKGGDLICVLFQSALSVLRTTDGCLVARAEVPVEESGTQFISYVGTANLRKAFLADFRGTIHVFDLEPAKEEKSTVDVEVASEEPPVSILPRLGKLELPDSIAIPVAMTVINETPYQMKVLLVGTDGRVSILQVPGARGASTNHFSVLSEISQQFIFGGNDINCNVSPTIAGVERKEGLVYQRCVCDRTGLHITCLGMDGAVRVFHPLSLLGANVSDDQGKQIHLDVPTREEKDQQRRKGMGRSIDTKIKTTHASRLREGKIFQDITSRNETDPLRVKESIKSGTAPVEVVKPKNVVLTTKQKIDKARKNMKKEEQLKNPLYKLAEFVNPKNRITNSKLEAHLSLHGEYPERYRTLIWRFLLKLPENADNYAKLVRKGPHPSFDDLQNKFPIKSRRVFERLHRCCCHLAHWSSHFGKTKYIAQIIFPFILIYTSDELAALETVLTILNWWGHSWQASWPQPPVHILDASDRLLHHHDGKLHNHCRSSNVSVGVLCWNMVSTLFTEVSSKTDWLVLMDFLFTFFEVPEYFYLVPIAIMRATRTQCMCICDEMAIVKFYRYQQTMNIGDVIRSVKEMYDNTPRKLLSIVARPKRSKIEGAEGSDVDLTRTAFRQGYDEKAQARESIADSRGKAIFPLPIGNYPAFQGVGDFIVDWQLRDRQRAMELDKTVESKETRIRELEEHIAKMQSDFEEWKSRNKDATPISVDMRKKAVEEERILNRELLAIERDIADRKIQALEAEEKASREELELYEKMEAESQALVAQSEEFMNEKMDTMLEIQRLRGMTATAEAQSEERMAEMYRHKTRDMQMTSMKHEMEAREMEMQKKVSLLSEGWKSQDILDEQKRALREKAIRENTDRESFKALQDNLIDKMQQLQLSREQKIIEIERQRALRMAREQADEAEDIAKRARKAHQKSNEFQLKSAKADIAEEGLKAMQQYIERTVNTIREEGQKLINEEKKYLQEQVQTEQGMRNAELRQQWVQIKANHLKQVLVSEKLIQEHILRMRRSAMQMEEMMKAQESEQDEYDTQKSVQNFQAQLEKMGQDIVNEQREKFQGLREKELNFGMQQRSEVRDPMEEKDDLDMTTSSNDSIGLAKSKSESEIRATKAYDDTSSNNNSRGNGNTVSTSYGVSDYEFEHRPDDSITKYSSGIDASSYVDVNVAPEVADDEEYSLESLLGSPPTSSLDATKNMTHGTTTSSNFDVTNDSQNYIDGTRSEYMELKTTTFNPRVSVDSGSSGSLRESLESITDESLRVLNETRAQARRERIDEEKFISSLTQRVKAYSLTDPTTVSSAATTIDLSLQAPRTYRERQEASPLPPAVKGLMEKSLDLGDTSFGGDSALWAAFSGSEKGDDNSSTDDLDDAFGSTSI